MQHGLFNFASFPKGVLSNSNTSGLRPLNSNTEGHSDHEFDLTVLIRGTDGLALLNFLAIVNDHMAITFLQCPIG